MICKDILKKRDINKISTIKIFLFQNDNFLIKKFLVSRFSSLFFYFFCNLFIPSLSKLFSVKQFQAIFIYKGLTNF